MNSNTTHDSAALAAFRSMWICEARARKAGHDAVRDQYLAQAKAFEMRGYSHVGGHGSRAYRIMDAAYRAYHGVAFGARVPS